MYNYAKASQLGHKAERLLRYHRQHVFEHDAHYRAIKRIKALMMPLWTTRSEEVAERRMEIYFL